MKILALADIHGKESVSYMAQEIYGMEKFDLILIAGDITDFGSGENAREIIDSMPTHVMAVPGNCDPKDVIEGIEKSKATNLHKNKKEYKGYEFVGLGGVNGGFNMGITFSDEFAFQFLKDCKECIFLLHQPPYGILDEVPGGKHIGSLGIKKAVEIARPILMVSGHVHEARGYKKIGDSVFVNPGPAKHGYAAIIDTEGMKVNMLEL